MRISKRPREVERPGLVGQHHQGNDRDDGRLEEGSADRQEPDFTLCFFIHHSANALAPGSFRVHWQGGVALMSAGQAPRRAVQSLRRLGLASGFGPAGCFAQAGLRWCGGWRRMNLGGSHDQAQIQCGPLSRPKGQQAQIPRAICAGGVKGVTAGRACQIQNGAFASFWPLADNFHPGKRQNYSITPSAMASTPAGIVRPSVFAVLRLMINSNAAGLSIGNSPGLVPLRIFFENQRSTALA